MSNETDSFVQEVDQSLREDRLMSFLRRWGPWLAGAFALVLVGVLVWQGYQAYALNESRKHAVLYAAAQEMVRNGNVAGAKAEFERLSTQGPQIYRVMAQIEHAAITESEGDLEAALAEYDRAAEAARDPIMRDSVRMRAAYIAADTEDFAALQRRLQPLIDSDTRFSYLAKELLAIEAWEAGQNDLARDTLESLSLAFDAPEPVRQRAQMALNVVGPAPAAADGATPAPAPSEGETP